MVCCHNLFCCDLYFQEAYEHARRCCVNIRPNRSFVEQLSKWEEELFGQRTTDITDPNFWDTNSLIDYLCKQMKKITPKLYPKSAFHIENIINGINLLQMNVFGVLPWKVLNTNAQNFSHQ